MLQARNWKSGQNSPAGSYSILVNNIVLNILSYTDYRSSIPVVFFGISVYASLYICISYLYVIIHQFDRLFGQGRGLRGHVALSVRAGGGQAARFWLVYIKQSVCVCLSVCLFLFSFTSPPSALSFNIFYFFPFPFLTRFTYFLAFPSLPILSE